MSHDLKRTKCQENRLKSPDPVSLVEGRGLGTRLVTPLVSAPDPHVTFVKESREGLGPRLTPLRVPPLRNTHMTTATYYVYVRRYAAAELSEPMTFVQRSVSRGRATVELEFWH